MTDNAAPSATWTQRLVPVPVWSLLLLGGAMAGGGGALGIMSQDAQAGQVDDLRTDAKLEGLSASLRRIEGRLDAIDRQLSTVASMAHTHTGGR
jgi:hypothetical protein